MRSFLVNVFVLLAHAVVLAKLADRAQAVTLNATGSPTHTATNTLTPTPTPMTIHLSWSSYLGGKTVAPTRTAGPYAPPPGNSGKTEIRFMAFDTQGNLYVTGQAATSDFPHTIGPPEAGDVDAFVAKFKPTGELLWSRLLGGPNHDRTYGVAVAHDDSYVLICGRAGPDLPTTPGVFQPTFQGDTHAGTEYGPQDAFVAEINADGSTRWVTYAAMDGPDNMRSCDLGPHGEVYLGWTGAKYGATKSLATAGAFRTTFCSDTGATYGVGKMTPDGASMIWFTYMCGSLSTSQVPNGPMVKVRDLCSGGSRDGLACFTDTDCSGGGVCTAGEVFFKSGPLKTDTDFFLSDAGQSVLINALVPVYPRDGCSGIAVIAADGSHLDFSSFWVGSTEIDGIDVLPDGRMLVCTSVNSTDGMVPAFALATQDGFQSAYGGGGFDCEASKIDWQAPAAIATYLGGNDWDGAQCMCATDFRADLSNPQGLLWYITNSQSTNFLVTPLHFQGTLSDTIDATGTLFWPDLRGIGYSTYFGATTGTGMEPRHAAMHQPQGYYAIGGSTGNATDVPMQNCYECSAPSGGAIDDGFVAVFADGGPVGTWTPTTTAALTPIVTATATVTTSPPDTPTTANTSTPSPTRTSTAPPVSSPASTDTPTATFTRAITPTVTSSLTPTPTPTPTSTKTATSTYTRTNTSTPSHTLTSTATPVNAPTGTDTPTQSPSIAPTITPSGMSTPTGPPTSSPAPSNTATAQPTATATATASATATNTMASTASPTNPPTPTASAPAPTSTATGTATAPPAQTATDTAVATATNTSPAPASATSIPTATPSPPAATLTQTPVSTATLSPSIACVGDCNHSTTVTGDELLTMVAIALGSLDGSACDDAHGRVSVDEILAAVNNAVDACAAH